MTGQIGGALAITLLSAIALNWGYLREHEAARGLPPLSISRPWQTARLLLASRAWLTGFAAEMAGWGLFVVALALAPLALVQAVSAGGIGILAALVTRLRPGSLSARERLGVVLSVAGLALLGVSLAGGVGAGREASWTSLGLWLMGSAGAAAAVIGLARSRVGAGAAFGAATGIAFAAGDVATKATVGGDIALLPVLVACYGAGTMLLQMGFQRGGALVVAGLATLLTNAIPIVAGATIFHEPLPGGALGALRVLAFATVVVSGVLLARQDPRALDQDAVPHAAARRAGARERGDLAHDRHRAPCGAADAALLPGHQAAGRPVQPAGQPDPAAVRDPAGA
jgi:hypothetical protein